MRFFAVIVALCAVGAFAAWVVLRDDDHWRDGDPRHASRGWFRGALIALAACCILIGACIVGAISAHARPSPYPPVTQFNGDRYGAQAQMGSDVVKAVRIKRGKARYLYPTRKRPPVSRPKWQHVPTPKPRPGTVGRLSGVVAPLAAKAREIVANCGSEVISGVRHTYIAGTGGRLSLHASGRAVDIKGNPACIRAHLHGWPGGASVDYAAVNHTHISYAPGGPEWGSRFRHHTHRHRHRRRA